MKEMLRSAAVAVIAIVISMVLAAVKGIEAYIYLPVGGVILAAALIITCVQQRKDSNSFKEAEKLREGQLFRSDKEEQRYHRFAEKHEPSRPRKEMLGDVVSRYRSLAVAAELAGALALGIILIILFAEERENRGEPGVKYIVIAGIVILLYMAASEIFGIKARRLYLKLSDRPDFERIQRSYEGGVIIGSSGNSVNIGDEFITLLAPNKIIPVKRSEIRLIRRANVIGGTDYNGKLLGSSSDAEVFYINFYVTPQEAAAPSLCKIRLSKFNMQLAFDILKSKGLPTEEEIDMR